MAGGRGQGGCCPPMCVLTIVASRGQGPHARGTLWLITQSCPPLTCGRPRVAPCVVSQKTGCGNREDAGKLGLQWSQRRCQKEDKGGRVSLAERRAVLCKYRGLVAGGRATLGRPGKAGLAGTGLGSAGRPPPAPDCQEGFALRPARRFWFSPVQTDAQSSVPERRQGARGPRPGPTGGLFGRVEAVPAQPGWEV